MGRQKVTACLFLFIESTDLEVLWWGVTGRNKVISMLFHFILGIALESVARVMCSSDLLFARDLIMSAVPFDLVLITVYANFTELKA
jgi:hypothetical protein